MEAASHQLAASHLSDKNDPTLLTQKEIKDSWGSISNFMISHGLKPYNPEDCKQAVDISRALKEGKEDVNSGGNK